jgi:hypothetical protein
MSRVDKWNASLAWLWFTFMGRARDERGDVPGWVLVTVMTAGLVMALWGVAREQLQQMLRDALNQVR